jgi:multidrug efflux system outer membrane protein
MRKALIGFAAAGITAGCAVGPNYQLPQTPDPSHFANAQEPGLSENDAVERYWTVLGDPLLDTLVDDAIAHNKYLEAAQANLRAARAARRLAGFDQFPTVTLSSSYTHELESAQQLPGYDRQQREFDAADAGFTVRSCPPQRRSRARRCGCRRGNVAGRTRQHHRRVES